jgi:serine phosphatase RsbU (regulator of sigma subunit)
MSLRTKIVVWFLLLSVLPLAAIVSYSYFASSRALRRAVMTETWELAAGLQSNMEATRGELAERVQELHGLPWQELLSQARLGRDGLDARSEAVFAELAPFVDSLEFIPAPPRASAPARQRVAAAPPAPPAVAVPPAAPRPATPAAPQLEPVVIDLSTFLSVDPKELAAAWGSDEVLADWRGDGFGDLGVEVAGAALDAMRRAFAGEGLDAEARERLEAAGERLAIHAQAIRKLSTMEDKERERLEVRKKEAERVLGQQYACPVEVEGEEIGSLRASVLASRVVGQVLGRADRSEGEIPFAYDAERHVYLADPADQRPLEAIGLVDKGRLVERHEIDDWVVAYLVDEDSDLTFGIARPIQDSVRELRRTAGRNFGLGFGLVGLALIGVVPLSRRITRDLQELTVGSERLAAGNWEARVPVRSRDEVGKLAQSFNRLARELAENQQRLVDTQLQRQLLEAENERKTLELEEARKFQFSLLPKRVPQHPDIEVAVFMRTATEVGGDYYDFQHAADGTLTTVIGDATGHGAKAGTMVTVIKSLFTAWPADAGLAEFLTEAAMSVKAMDLGRMAMAVALARIDGRSLKVSSAGMPPVLVCHADGAVEEIALAGLPLGGMARCRYDERTVDLDPGDTLLLMSDGFPELPNADGEPLGYERVRRLFEGSCKQTPQAVIDELAAAAEAWRPGSAPADDITFVVLRLRGAARDAG